jgi:hypothetical protein
LHHLLGLLGAEIIKVEIPGGEMGRRMAPPGPPRDAGLGAGFIIAQSAGKRMLAVDIKSRQAPRSCNGCCATPMSLSKAFGRVRWRGPALTRRRCAC